MKHFTTLLLGAMTLCVPAFGQTYTAPSGQVYVQPSTGTAVFGTVTAVGMLPQIITFGSSPGAPGTYTLSWWNAGTKATTCTLQPLGGFVDSSGTIHWYQTAAAVDCSTLPPAANASVVIQTTPFQLIGAQITAYAAGDASTKITVGITLGR